MYMLMHVLEDILFNIIFIEHSMNTESCKNYVKIICIISVIIILVYS